MQQSVVQAFPEAPVSIAIVWIDMLPWDSERAAKKSAGILSKSPRIRQFYDPDQRVGDALAKEFGWSATAWDIYLFYPKGAEWRGKPPAPSTYVHQLAKRSEDGHFYSGEDLVRELRKRMAATVAQASPGPKKPAKPK